MRAIQLAKAALHAGTRLLIDRMGIDKVGSVGNAAGTGARIALLNFPSRLEIGEILPKVEKIETAIEPKFQEYFIEAMAIPHKADPYRELGKVVPLPAPTPKAESSDGGDSRRRSRRRRRA